MMYAMQYKLEKKRFFGLSRKITKPTSVVDEEGVIRLQKQDGKIHRCTGDGWEKALSRAVEEMTEYNDGGKTLPNTYIIYGKRIIDLSGMIDEEHLKSLAKVELSLARPEDKLFILCSARTD